jgi:hypothetical protein
MYFLSKDSLDRNSANTKHESSSGLGQLNILV